MDNNIKFEQEKQRVLNSLNILPGWRKQIEFLIQNEDDLNNFKINYWEKNNYDTVISVSKFHEYKMDQNHMEQDEFIEMFNNDSIAAIKRLFQTDEVYESDINNIKLNMQKNPDLLKDLYWNHMKDKKENFRSIMLLVRSGVWSKVA